MSGTAPLRARRLLVRRPPGLQDYLPVWEAMRRFTDQRDAATADELWLLEHPPVLTLGQAGREAHLRDPGSIQVIKVDRGGQVTYHGPGQLIAYLLLDLKAAGLGVKGLVHRLEQSVIDLLAGWGVDAQRRVDAPGVYVAGAKVASLGLRVRHGCSYHGLALNVAMDLSPFSRIDPCGYPGLALTQVSDLVADVTMDETKDRLVRALAERLDMTPVSAGESARFPPDTGQRQASA
ncbi:MAG: lipoyl(octanoyl) transferase LipB [Sphingobacteriia bacterium]|nr:lipoyl(octanoyl) transferase LipB [Sphingobacteriia bacterium]NCC38118.1 lipoyl(octanoyl) transferase LipB [Gammaproteobacteria bacterium]